MVDSLFMGTGLHGLGSSKTINSWPDIRPGPTQLPAVGRSSGITTSSSSKLSKSYLFGGGNKRNTKRVALNDDDGVMLEGNLGNSDELEGQNGNWVLKILHIRSLWLEKQKMGGGENEGQNGNFSSSSSSFVDVHDCQDGCCNYDDDDDDDDEEKGEVNFDRESFSKMLKKVSLAEAKLFAQMAHLSNLAYAIPSIKPRNQLKRYGLCYVTSSIEKREQLVLADEKKPQDGSSDDDGSKESSQIKGEERDDHKNDQSRLSASAAIQIAASAASYLHTQTKSIVTILPLGSSRDEMYGSTKNVNGRCDNHLEINSDMASLKATTDSVTAVVAAKEELKQAVADDLNSTSSSPCEWYVCDDEKTATRYFVIQGSETLASWQANLLFEPIQFEGLDVFVHTGIYEAAKGIYQQILPEVLAFLKAHGKQAKFRFTGHSLGGSLSLLLNLMLLIRGVALCSSLLPVITFGSPCIMCGGDYLLSKMGLPKSHVQAIVMHRDIVPRAFACSYPGPAAQLLKAINGNFRNHPCLNNQKLLYAPMGEMLILQPDAKYSPQHDLLPSGTSLFILTAEAYNNEEAEKQLRSAKAAFLNTPHPLEILSDRSAYGNAGAILRDHDMNSYLKCLRSVIHQEIRRLRKTEGEKRKKEWWPMRLPRVMVGTTFRLPTRRRIRESIRQLSKVVKSQDIHLMVVLLFPVRMLLKLIFEVFI